jgi:hypothetical protein
MTSQRSNISFVSIIQNNIKGMYYTGFNVVLLYSLTSEGNIYIKKTIFNQFTMMLKDFVILIKISSLLNYINK